MTEDNSEWEPFLRVIRSQYPNTIREELQSEVSTDSPDSIEYDLVQDIEIEDPRQMSPPWFGERKEIVRIVRVVKKIPKDPKTLFCIVPMKTLEVLKEYSYEEWDAGLKAFEKEENNVSNS